MEMMLGSNFSNPGYLTSNPGVIKSFVSSGNQGTSGKSLANGGFLAEDFFYNDSMLELLRGWELTQSILDVFKTTIQDVFSSSDVKVDTGVKLLNEEIDDFIKSIGLQSSLMQNLEDDLYYGQRAFYVDFESKSILNIDDGRNFDQVKYLGKPFKYRFSAGENKTLIEYSKICSISFNTRRVGLSKSDKVMSKNNKLNNIIFDLEYYRGQSVLKNVLYLIFQHFLKSLLASLLSLKNTMKPSLIKADIQPGTNQEINITEAINNIEAFLNQGEYTFDFRTSNAASIISSIYNSIVNGVKVVPGLSNYTSMDVLNLPDETGKIEALNRDKQELQNEIVNKVGIPEELLGGSANRWEVIARSSRFHSIVKTHIDSVIDTYKQVARLFLKVKKNKNVSIDSIKFNLGTNNYLYTSGNMNKIQMLTESMDKVTGLLDSLGRLKNNEFCNPDSASEYIKNFLESTDSGLAKIIDLSKKKPESSELI